MSMKLVWVPDDEDEHSRLDKESYGKIMWKVMDKIFAQLQSTSTMNTGEMIYSTAVLMRDVKRALTNVWEEAKSFRISNEVHMVESSVLDRLGRDGLFPWVRDPKLEGYKFYMCLAMRRDKVFQYGFASVVGKRYLSERIISANRVQIIDHHRTTSWAEREYLSFANLVKQEADHLRRLMYEMPGSVFYSKSRVYLEMLHNETVYAVDNSDGTSAFLRQMWDKIKEVEYHIRDVPVFVEFRKTFLRPFIDDFRNRCDRWSRLCQRFDASDLFVLDAYRKDHNIFDEDVAAFESFTGIQVSNRKDRKATSVEVEKAKYWLKVLEKIKGDERFVLDILASSMHPNEVSLFVDRFIFEIPMQPRVLQRCLKILEEHLGDESVLERVVLFHDYTRMMDDKYNIRITNNKASTHRTKNMVNLLAD